MNIKCQEMGRVDFKKDLVRGSLIGGAIGDALGYSVPVTVFLVRLRKLMWQVVK